MYKITDVFHNKIKCKEDELLNHIEKIDKTVEVFISSNNLMNMNWNVQKTIGFYGKNVAKKTPNTQSDLAFYKSNYPLVGNNDKHVAYIVLKSDLSDLNFGDIMIEVLFERLLLLYPHTKEDKKKFNSKVLTSYIIILMKKSYSKNRMGMG